MKKYYLSEQRLIDLKAELEELKTTKRIEIAERLKRAKEYGDLSANAEYDSAREEQSDIEDRIDELEDLIKNASVIQKGGRSDFVDVGSEVEVEVNKKTKKFSIVGSSEAKPEEGLISNESPIGKALVGKKVGDIAVVSAPAGEIKYKIISIN